MQFKQIVNVMGIKRSKGTMDNGQSFDSTKFYIEGDMDDSKGNAKGTCTTEYTFGTSEEFAKYAHLPFPFEAEAVFDIVSNGKAARVALEDLRPIAKKADGAK